MKGVNVQQHQQKDLQYKQNGSMLQAPMHPMLALEREFATALVPILVVLEGVHSDFFLIRYERQNQSKIA